MPTFIARVELHGARYPDDYQDFHERMEAEGHYKTIKGRNGVTYRLPAATYSAIKNGISTRSVRDEVSQIAADTGFRISVLVAKAPSVAWRLRQAE